MHDDSEAYDETEQRAPGRHRSRAADLFSAHRYREFQLRLFARRSAGHSASEYEWTEADDLYDPIVGDDSPTMSGDFAPIPASGATAAGSERAAEHPGGATLVDAGEDDASAVAADPEATQLLTPVTDAESPKPAGGRNLKLATLVGVPLFIAVLATAYWSQLLFAVVVYGLCIAGAVEWGRALARRGRRIPMVPIIAAIIGMGVSTWYALAEGLVVALLVGCAGVVAWRLGDERIENTLADSMASMLTLMWIPFLASFMLLLEIPEDGWKRVFIVIIAVVGNDTGGLLFGKLLGRHKLLPRVSPAKTWEGMGGGLLLGTVAATVAAYFMFEGAWHIGAVVGLVSAVAAVVGDLAESAIKRDMNLKDMSGAIPGHGGVLDRLDSMVFAAPVAYVFFAIFLGTL